MFTEQKRSVRGILAGDVVLPPGDLAAFDFPEFSGKVSIMIKLKDLIGVLRLMSLALALAVLLAAAASALIPANARAGDGTWQDLVLLYTTDIKGKIEPCG